MTQDLFRQSAFAIYFRQFSNINQELPHRALKSSDKSEAKLVVFSLELRNAL